MAREPQNQQGTTNQGSQGNQQQGGTTPGSQTGSQNLNKGGMQDKSWKQTPQDAEIE